MTVIDDTAHWSDHRNVDLGPHNLNGSLYVVLCERMNGIGSIRVDMYKSEDDGMSWNVVDAANAVDDALDEEFISTSVHDGVIYVIYYWRVDPNSTSTDEGPRVIPFDPETDSWGSSIPEPAWTGDRSDITGLWPLHFVARGDSNYVIFHQSPPEMIMGTDYRRVNYSLYKGAWFLDQAPNEGFGTDEESHYDVRAIIGVDDEVWMFYTRTSSDDLLLRRFDSNDDSVSDEIIVGSASGTYACGLPAKYQDEFNDWHVILPHRGPSIAPTLRESRTKKDNPLSWVEQTIISEPPSSESNPAAIVVDGSERAWSVHVPSTHNLHISTDLDSNNWIGNGRHIESTTLGVTASILADGIGIMYNDDETPMFTRYPLVAPPVQSNTVLLNENPLQIAISPITPAQSILLHGAATPDAGAIFGDQMNIRARLLDEVTIEFETVDINDPFPEITWYVAENEGFSVQSGTEIIPDDTNSHDVIIDSVPLDRTFVLTSFFSPGQSVMNRYNAGHLVDNTTLRLTQRDANNVAETFWQVVTLPEGANVQRGSVTPSTLFDEFVSINSVDLSRSWLVYQWGGPNTDDDQRSERNAIQGRFEDSSTLHFGRRDLRSGSGQEMDIYWEVVEWSGWNVQQIDSTLNSEFAQNEAISPIDLDQTFVNGGAFGVGSYARTPDSGANEHDSVNARAELIDSDTLQIIRANNALESIYTFQIIEFTEEEPEPPPEVSAVSPPISTQMIT